MRLLLLIGLLTLFVGLVIYAELCGEHVWTRASTNGLAIIIGVFIGFWLEDSRRCREERKTVQSLIESVYTESENNKEIINGIIDKATPDKPVHKDIGIYSMQTALTSPLTYTHATETLTTIMHMSLSRLVEFKNWNERQRSGGNFSKKFDTGELKELNFFGTKCIKLIDEVLLPEVISSLSTCWTQKRKASLEKIRARIKEIFKSG